MAKATAAKAKTTKKAAAPKAAPKAAAAMPMSGGKMHHTHVNPYLAVGLLVVIMGLAVVAWQGQEEESSVAPVLTAKTK